MYFIFFNNFCIMDKREYELGLILENSLVVKNKLKLKFMFLKIPFAFTTYFMTIFNFMCPIFFY